MNSLTKILLPVDFSERSLGAARYAKTLAGHFHSELTLLHVLAPPHYEFGALEGGTMLGDLYKDRADQVTRELEEFMATELTGVTAEGVVLDGDAARQIVNYAHSHDIGLIIMPTHGYGPFRRFILGSITAKVLHDADCPVWTGVHLEQAPVTPAVPFHNVVCAIDLGPQSCKTLEWAAGMQKEFGGRLTVIHAMTCSPETEHAETQWKLDMERAAREDLARLQSRFGVEAELLIEPGDPPAVVCQTVQRQKADLLVIGRGSAAGVFGRLRTNAYAIIRQSPCPVVSV